jgi:hypothetical protein
VPLFAIFTGKNSQIPQEIEENFFGGICTSPNTLFLDLYIFEKFPKKSNSKKKLKKQR